MFGQIKFGRLEPAAQLIGQSRRMPHRVPESSQSCTPVPPSWRDLSREANGWSPGRCRCASRLKTSGCLDRFFPIRDRLDPPFAQEGIYEVEVSGFPSSFGAADDAARAIRHALGGHWTARPYDMHRPGGSPWYLTPTTEWPAYARGKILVARIVNDLFVGLYVEKGIKLEAASAYYGTSIPPGVKRMIMDPSWTWHRVLEAMRTGALERKVRDAGLKARAPLVVHADLGAWLPRENANPHGTSAPICLQWVARGERLEAAHEVSPRGVDMKGLAGADDFPSLARNLASVGQGPWSWIDLYMGFQRPAALSRVGQSSAPWSVEDVVAYVVNPFSDWLR